MDLQTNRFLFPRPAQKRSRAIYSCTECRYRKIRCSKSCPRPCSACIQFSRTCVYASNTSKTKSPSFQSSNSSPPDDVTTSEQAFTTDTPLESSQVPEPFLFTGDPGASGPTLNDVCLQLGKLSITERVGGILRPDIVKTLDMILSTAPQSQRNYNRSTNISTICTPLVAWFKPLHLVSLIRPGPATGEELQYFPSRAICDVLTAQYFLAVDPIAHLIQRAFFENLVSEIYDNPVRPGLLAGKTLILAVCFAAATSMPFLQVQSKLQTSKPTLVAKLIAAVEWFLQAGDVLSSSQTAMLQAVCIYLMPQCRAEVSRSHSVFIGALVRSAQIAGIDQLSSSGDPSQIQLRRMLWHQLAFYDLRTAEAQGPAPMLAPYANEMPFPANMSDQDLDAASTLAEDSQHTNFTDATLSLIRYECYDVHRQIFRDRERIRRGQATLSDVVASIDSRRMYIEKTYINSLDEDVPIQKYAKVVATLLMARFGGMMLYDNVVKQNTVLHDPVLGDRFIQSALAIVENGALLETDSDLAPWAWYAGTYQQYHSLLPLMVELYQHPSMPDRERILAIADHVFGGSVAMGSHERCGMILQTIRDKLEVLLTSRGFSNVSGKPVAAMMGEAQSPLSESFAWGESGFAGDDQLLDLIDNIEFSNSWWQLPSM